MGRYMRRHEKALEEQAVACRIGTEFVAQSRRRQIVCRRRDQIFPAGNVAACRRDAAAGVFDERAGDNIGAGFNRFFFGGEFAVAVVDKADRLRAYGFDGLNDFADVGNLQGRPRAVAAGTLNQHQLRLRRPYFFPDAFQIIGVVLQRHFIIYDALFLQGMRRFVGIADNALHRVVRRADEGYHRIAVLQESAQHRS